MSERESMRERGRKREKERDFSFTVATMANQELLPSFQCVDEVQMFGPSADAFICLMNSTFLG